MLEGQTFRVGIDIGGTFTDIVLLGSNGLVRTKKVSSTPDDYGRGIVRGLLEVLRDLGVLPADVEGVVHATTVAANAVLEGKGAKTGLITTQGFRDVLALRRIRIPVMYNPEYEKPAPLVPRRLCMEVVERMGSKGEVRVRLNEESVVDATCRLRDEGVEAVAICLINSYVNPVHEQKVATLVRGLMPSNTYISCSHEILPEIREYERTSTAVVNALLGPVVTRYLASLSRQLAEMGISRPLQIMQSNGGLMSARSATEKPVSILESGPAAGVIAAAGVAKRVGVLNLITLDMGGTTAKAAIIERGEATKTTEYEVGAGINLSSKLASGGGYPIKLPVVDVSEIGAGGGSQVWIDRGGHMHVGPQSAGAVPGPVCYGTGGKQVTLTDALVTLGYLNPNYLVGGAVPLDAEKARRAVEEQIGKPLQKSTLEAAYGVYTIAGSNMTRAVKAVSTFRGRDPRDYTLYAFGGNGPILALEIARILGMNRLLIPPNPGVFSALGLLLSDVEHGVHQTMLGHLQELAPEEIGMVCAKLQSEVSDLFAAEGYGPAEVEIKRYADLRYLEQAFELTIPLGPGSITRELLDQLATDFHSEHERTYGHKRESGSIELVNLRVIARAATRGSRDFDPASQIIPQNGSNQARRERMAYFGPDHGSLATPVISRAELFGRESESPLIIEEYDATCVIPPGYRVSLDSAANIDIRPIEIAVSRNELSL